MSHSRLRSSVPAWALTLLAQVFVALPMAAEIAVPSDGSDGVFAPTTNTVIDLGKAATGRWDVTSPVSGQGVYDAAQWAVVFKYAAVTVPTNVTVRFRNHPSGAPVVWLVQGEVRIRGTVNLDGESGEAAFRDGQRMTRGGPGGFRGGLGATQGLDLGSGHGPGRFSGAHGGGGAFSDLETITRTGYVYGNSRIVPLIGGSGGSGYGVATQIGGAGGGAILIATRSVLTLSGTIQCRGGDYGGGDGWGGSGGSIRLLAETLVGANGLLDTRGLRVHPSVGRIRVEAIRHEGQFAAYPTVPVVEPESPPRIWPEPGAPEVRVVSVDTVLAPQDPMAEFASGADLTLQSAGIREVKVETRNMPVTALVRVLLIPERGKPIVVPATHRTGDTAAAIWVAQVDIPKGFASIQVVAEEP